MFFYGFRTQYLRPAGIPDDEIRQISGAPVARLPRRGRASTGPSTANRQCFGFRKRASRLRGRFKACEIYLPSTAQGIEAKREFDENSDTRFNRLAELERVVQAKRGKMRRKALERDLLPCGTAQRRQTFAVPDLLRRVKWRSDGVRRQFSMSLPPPTTQRSCAARRNTWDWLSQVLQRRTLLSFTYISASSFRLQAAGRASGASLFSRGQCNRRAVLVKPARHAITSLQHFTDMTNEYAMARFYTWHKNAQNSGQAHQYQPVALH